MIQTFNNHNDTTLSSTTSEMGPNPLTDKIEIIQTDVAYDN